MRRPLCVFCLMTAAAIWISVVFFPADTGEPVIDEQSYITLSAVVESVELMAGEPGSTGSSCRICLKKIRAPGMESLAESCRILCYLDGEAPLPGDRVEVRGKPGYFRSASNEGEFDAAQYYRAMGFSFRMTDARILSLQPGRGPAAAADRILSRWKRVLGRALDCCFAEEEAGVMRAVLLGERGMADDELLSLYRRGGILHLLVISGLHISLLGTVLFLALKKLRCPRRAAAAVSVTGIGLYGRMAGMSSSIFRAVWMYAMRTAAPCFQRTYDLPTAAAAAAALLLCIHPFLALQSGFLYSFSAVFGIAFLAPAMPEKLSFAAVPAAVLPVQLWFYYGFAPYGTLLTVLFVPFLPVLLASGACVCILFPVSHGAAMAAAYPAHLILTFYRFTAEKAELLPGAFMISGRPAAWQIAVYYMVLFMSFYIRRPASPKRTFTGEDRRKSACIYLLRFAGTASAAAILLARPVNGLTVSFLDVGQGDGICIQTGGCAILVDGGSSTRQSLGESVLLPFLMYRGISELDLAILTHEDYDHCSGMIEVLEQAGKPGGIRIGTLALPDVNESCRGEKYRAVEQLAQQNHIEIFYYNRGDIIRAGEVKLECLHPETGMDFEDSNEGSGVFLLQYGGFSALLTGDLEGKGEEQVSRLLKNTGSLHLTVLKVSHHGSAGATGDDFLDSVSAGYAVISCGKNNRYGHPAPETVKKLEEAGCRILDTRYCGEISFHADPPTQGSNIWYNTVKHGNGNLLQPYMPADR